MASERKIDLHTHTSHSDGTYSPTDVVKLAKQAGLSCIAITDHDTVSGVEEAQAEGAKLGVEVISGIEISVQFGPGTFHMLGYFLDFRSTILLRALDEVQAARRARNPKIVEKLCSLGMVMTLDEVAKESGGEQIGRPHFARVMMKKGYVKTFDEAFDRYLTKGGPAYVEKRKLSSREAVSAIHAAGGLAVLAHPKQMQLDHTPNQLFNEVKRLRDEGLSGIEVFSSCQSETEAARYSKIADELGLLKTGGSDFHGDIHTDVVLGELGDGAELSYDVVDQMKQRLLDRKSK